jgi:hypothetical protein
MAIAPTIFAQWLDLVLAQHGTHVYYQYARRLVLVPTTNLWCHFLFALVAQTLVRHGLVVVVIDIINVQNKHDPIIDILLLLLLTKPTSFTDKHLA